MTKTAPGYAYLKRVVGVWDDHDYGSNDAGRELVERDRNRKLFLDFLDEPVDTDRRLQEGTPIH
jgi:alkaline phosphatase D